MHKVYVAYVLNELPFDPDEVTATSGIVPSKIWRVGDLVVDQGTRRHRQNGWSVQSGLGTDAALTDQIASVLSRLSTSWEYLCELGRSAQSGLQCTIYMYEAQGPETTIDPTVLRQLAELNASLDYDIYSLGSKREAS